jgi:hypothetical protein
MFDPVPWLIVAVLYVFVLYLYRRDCKRRQGMTAEERLQDDIDRQTW